jgi:hypothetical protein
LRNVSEENFRNKCKKFFPKIFFSPENIFPFWKTFGGVNKNFPSVNFWRGM